MPTILRVDGYRFFFYSNEGNEPAHIHIQKAEGYAKFWLNPVNLADTTGFSQRQLQRIEEIIREHVVQLQEAWDEYFTG